MIGLIIFGILFFFICVYAYRLIKTSEDDFIKLEVLTMLGVMVIAIMPLFVFGYVGISLI